MNPSAFFIEEEDPEWAAKGLDPERRMRTVLDREFLERLRRNPDPLVNDIEAAYGLVQLASDELVEYGTRGDPA